MKSKHQARMLILSITGQCNFACTYCYAVSHAQDVMTLETAKKAIRLLAQQERPWVLQITGGEPLLYFERVREIIEFALQENPMVRPQIQTNGSLLTEEMVEFFKKSHCGVGISLDGTAEINGRTRRLKNGGDPFNAITQGIQLLQKQEMICGLTCVISKENIERLTDVIDLATYFGNVRRVGFNLLKPSGNGKEMEAPASVKIGEEIKKVYQRVEQLKSWGAFPLEIAQLHRMQLLKAKQFRPFEHCFGLTGEGAFVNARGEIYACASLGDQAEFLLGHVEEGVNLKYQREIAEKIRERMNSCFSCKELELCGGGCFSRWEKESCLQECALKKATIRQGKIHEM